MGWAALTGVSPGQPQVKVLRIGIPAGVVLPAYPVINAAVIVRGTLALNLKDGTTRVFQRRGHC